MPKKKTDKKKKGKVKFGEPIMVKMYKPTRWQRFWAWGDRALIEYDLAIFGILGAVLSMMVTIGFLSLLELWLK